MTMAIYLAVSALAIVSVERVCFCNEVTGRTLFFAAASVVMYMAACLALAFWRW